MTKLHMRRCLSASIGGAAVFLFVNSALAADFDRTGQLGKSDAIGNDNFNVQYNWVSMYNAYKYTYPTHVARQAATYQELSVTAHVFGEGLNILNTNCTGMGRQSQNAGTPTYSDLVYATARLLGTETIPNPVPAGDRPCNGSATKSCFSHSWYVERNLFNASGGPFMAGPIPFWVSGGINGYLQAGLSVDAYAAKYLGIPGSFMGSSNASLWSAAGATAYLSASAGIPNVAEIGFTGNFLLIDIRPSSNSQVKHTGPLTVNGTNYSALVEQRNYVPLWVATMGGSFDVWGKLAGVQHSVRLVSWNPWIFSGDLVWPIVTNEYIL